MMYYILCLFMIMPLEFTGDQQPGDILPVDIRQVASHLENQHGYRVFYHSTWFNERKFPGELLQLPAEQLLERLSADGRFRLLVIDGNYLVFLPLEYTSAGSAEREMLLVGNMTEYGKYTHPLMSGRVIDGQSSESLPGAIIQVEGSSRGTTTDINGDFSLRLPVGQHLLRVSYVGYEESPYHINLVSNGRVVFELFEKSHALGEVVVSSRRADANIIQSRMSQLRMDAKAIAELPAVFGEVDVVRSVSMLPGVLSVGEFGTGFNVRGGGMDQNLVLIEGMPLFNSSHLFGLISLINPDMVSQLTLIKGGIPAKYGERASSVLDVKMGSNEIKKMQFSGGLGMLNNRLSFKTPMFDGRSSLVAGARLSRTGWLLKKIPDVDLMNSSANFHDISGLFNTSLGPKNNVSVFGYSSNDFFRMSDLATHQYATQIVSMRWNTWINPQLSSSLVAGITRYNYQITEDRFATSFYRVTTGIDYRTAKWNLTSHGKNSVSEFGLQGSFYQIQPGDMFPVGEESLIVPLKMNTRHARELAAYFSSDVEFSDILSGEFGIRYSWYSLLGSSRVYLYEEGKPRLPEYIIDSLFFASKQRVIDYHGPEPRISLRYSIDSSSSLKFSYNRINQYISLLTNTSVAAPADVWEPSSYYIRPLVADQIAIGYFRNFLENMLETSIELYYKNLANVPEVRSGARIMMNEHIESDLLNAKGYNYGIECYIRRDKGRLTGWGSYTYSVSRRRSKEQLEQNQINRNQYYPSNYDQPHNLVVNANYHISRRWRFNSNFSYNTGRPVTLPELKYQHGRDQLIFFSDRNKYRLDDYHRLDVSLTYVGGLKLSRNWDSNFTLAVVNVYGRKNPYSVFYRKEVPRAENNYSTFNLYQLYIIGRPLPTFTLNFRF